ncbi:MAG: hypothetical protein AAF483_30530 [Planctomycetota bacterium]
MSTQNPYTPTPADNLPQGLNRKTSVLLFYISLGVFLALSGLLFEKNGVWLRMTESPLDGIAVLVILLSLHTIIYAPFSIFLRWIFEYPIPIWLPFLSAFVYAIAEGTFRFEAVPEHLWGPVKIGSAVISAIALELVVGMSLRESFDPVAFKGIKQLESEDT